MKSTVSVGLLGMATAIKVNNVPSDELTRKVENYPPHLHWNEDPHSVATPLNGKPYLTSTKARFISENSTSNSETKGPSPASASTASGASTTARPFQQQLSGTSSRHGVPWLSGSS